MDGWKVFEVVAGSMTIVGALIATLAWARKSFQTYRDRKDVAEKEFEVEMARLIASGGSVSARSDLGFLVTLRISSLRDDIGQMRFYGTTLCFMGVLGYVMRLSWESLPVDQDVLVSKIFIHTLSFIGLLGIAGAMLAFSQVNRLRQHSNKFESRMREVWRKPVDKRSQKSEG